MQKLGIDIRDIGMIFISHPHLDHVGGRADQAAGTFSLTQGETGIKNITAYTPEGLAASQWNRNIAVRQVKAPLLIRPGIASIGTIPRFLFIAGMVHEQSLAINVEKKGIVLIIGCGHPSVERIIERTRALFKERIYAIIGGLHFPINGGRINIGPLNLQYMVGKDSPPWDGLDMKDMDSAIQSMKNVNPAIIALSPHDSSDWALARFADAFKERFSIIKGGKMLQL
jgi:7,8-dihydropterin-6-yl-methyl-4-(beta-D-ribofuranosyl)aminobenzene 5'-phosphate synthase